MMPPWLFSLFLAGVVREVEAKVGNVGVELCMDDTIWKLNTVLFADDIVLIAESERDF